MIEVININHPIKITNSTMKNQKNVNDCTKLFLGEYDITDTNNKITVFCLNNHKNISS